MGFGKKIVFGAILLLLILVGAQALTPLFIGQVTIGTLFGGNIPDCYEYGYLGYGYSVGPIRPFLGEVVIANLIENSNNLPVINALGGNPVSEMERCTPSGNLIELGCSAGYSGANGIPSDYVGAIEFTPYDVDPSGNVRCEQYRTLTGSSINSPIVVVKPAFFHPSGQGFNYVSPGNPSAIITTTLNCPNVVISALPVYPNRQIVNLWVEGPAPYQLGNSVVGSQNICSVGMPCVLIVNLPTSGTYHSYVEEYDPNTGNSILTVDSLYC